MQQQDKTIFSSQKSVPQVPQKNYQKSTSNQQRQQVREEPVAQQQLNKSQRTTGALQTFNMSQQQPFSNVSSQQQQLTIKPIQLNKTAHLKMSAQVGKEIRGPNNQVIVRFFLLSLCIFFFLRG